MKSFRLVLVLLAVVAMMVTSGCASTNRLSQLSSEEDLSESSSFKGKTAKQVVQRLGKPQQKSADSKGKQIWEYKKPAEAHKTLNSFARISSFGIFSEDDAPYVDVLKLTLLNGVVTQQEYSENILNISLPGGLSGSQTSDSKAAGD